MQKRIYLSILAGLMAAGVVQGAPVSPDRAKEVASDFVRKATGKQMMRKASSGAMALSYTHIDKSSGLPTVYAFSRGKDGGYVLVAADDRAPLVLGYADRGNFNPASIPPSMQGMFESWSNQVAWLASHPDSQPSAPLKVSAPVAPLLGEIAWDQGDPYNRKCPAVTQYDSWGDPKGTGPAATGCVATALGQIMYYHKWPEVGHGSISYVSEGQNADGGSENINIDVTFEGTQYLWENMLPSISKTSSSEAIDAVSTLLFHVGAAFESIYGASTGATDVSVAPALVKYFDYDKGINYLQRDYCTTEEWTEKLLEEFAAGRPVAYGGVTRRAEGHFFVLDGVNEEGFYHVNWGWSGQENGYYLLTLLEPGSQGIGGSSDGSAFHYAQNMITGIQKPVEGSVANYNFTVESVESFDNTIGRQETAQLSANGVWNESPGDVTANLGFAMTDAEGNVVYRQMAKTGVEYKVAYGESSLKCTFVIPDNIPAGTYTVRPAYQISADNYAADRFMQPFHGRACGWRVEVTENNIKWTTEGAYKLTILEARGDNEGDIESGVTNAVTVKVRNDGSEFYGPVYLRLFINGKANVFGNNDYPDGWTKAKWVTIPGHCESEITFDTGKLNLPGHDDYVVRLRGNEGILSENYRPVSAVNLASLTGVKIVGPALPPVVELADDMILTTMVDGKVPVNDVGLKICLDNEGGEWTGQLRCAVKEADSWGGYIGYVTFDPVTIQPETEEQWLTLTGGVLPEACVPGERYELIIQDPVEDEAMIPSYYFSIELTAGEAVDKTSVLTLDELSFNPETVVAGRPSEVQFHVSNAGYPYNGTLGFTVSRAGEVVYRSVMQNVSIDRDDSSVIEFTETFELPTASDYTVTLVDAENKEVGHRDGITFTADEPALALNDATVIPATVNCNQPTDFVFGVTNTGFRFDSTLRFVILSEGETKYESEPRAVVLARGEDTTLTFGTSLNIPNSDNCLARLVDGAGATVGERRFSSVGYVGIDGIQAGDDSKVRYFNLQGMEIDNPEPGQVVIIVKGNKSFKAVITR